MRRRRFSKNMLQSGLLAYSGLDRLRENSSSSTKNQYLDSIDCPVQRQPVYYFSYSPPQCLSEPSYHGGSIELIRSSHCVPMIFT